MPMGGRFGWLLEGNKQSNNFKGLMVYEENFVQVEAINGHHNVGCLRKKSMKIVDIESL